MDTEFRRRFFANGFLAKTGKLDIGVKMTRHSMSDKHFVDQPIIDRTRYESHPDCESLVCFVFDPDGRIPNVNAINSDMNKGQANCMFVCSFFRESNNVTSTHNNTTHAKPVLRMV